MSKLYKSKKGMAFVFIAVIVLIFLVFLMALFLVTTGIIAALGGKGSVALGISASSENILTRELVYISEPDELTIENYSVFDNSNFNNSNFNRTGHSEETPFSTAISELIKQTFNSGRYKALCTVLIAASDTEVKNLGSGKEELGEMVNHYIVNAYSGGDKVVTNFSMKVMSQFLDTKRIVPYQFEFSDKGGKLRMKNYYTYFGECIK